MEKNDILSSVNEIFIDVLENDKIKLTPATTANEVDEWDSLTHIQLVVAIEKHFRIRFNSKDIQSWNNVGDLVASIQSKLK